MKPSELEKYCFYCQDEPARHIRKVAIRRKNGFKLADFDAHLCDNCNYLDDIVLSNYFSV